MIKFNNTLLFCSIFFFSGCITVCTEPDGGYIGEPRYMISNETNQDIQLVIFRSEKEPESDGLQLVGAGSIVEIHIESLESDSVTFYTTTDTITFYNNAGTNFSREEEAVERDFYVTANWQCDGECCSYTFPGPQVD